MLQIIQCTLLMVLKGLSIHVQYMYVHDSLIFWGPPIIISDSNKPPMGTWA